MFSRSKKLEQRNRLIKELISATTPGAFQLALHYVGDQDVAKDVVQQSLMKVLESMQLPQEGLQYWFLKIVRNTALDKIRQRKVKQRLAPGIQQHNELLLANSHNPEDDYQDEIKKAVSAGLATLSSEQKEIIVLKDIQGMSYEQIAIILDIAKGTVMSRLHRARLALKDAIQQQGFSF